LEPGALTKVLIATGDPRYQAHQAEVIDLTDSTNHCASSFDYPIITLATAGGLLNQVNPLVCGGYPNRDECFIIGGQNYAQQRLLEIRQYAASIALNTSHLWITGGYSIDYRYSPNAPLRSAF
jgi:hypothetical protein